MKEMIQYFGIPVLMTIVAIVFIIFINYSWVGVCINFALLLIHCFALSRIAGNKKKITQSGVDEIQVFREGVRTPMPVDDAIAEFVERNPELMSHEMTISPDHTSFTSPTMCMVLYYNESETQSSYLVSSSSPSVITICYCDSEEVEIRFYGCNKDSINLRHENFTEERFFQMTLLDDYGALTYDKIQILRRWNDEHLGV